MRAIITRPNSDGTYDEVGTNNRTVSYSYNTLRNLQRFAIPDNFKGKIRLEIFFSDSIPVGKPDLTIFVDR